MQNNRKVKIILSIYNPCTALDTEWTLVGHAGTGISMNVTWSSTLGEKWYYIKFMDDKKRLDNSEELNMLVALDVTGV